MPSQLHETLLLLFRNRPELAPELLRDVLQLQIPLYNQARIGSADLTDVQPAEYRADLVVVLYDMKPVLGIVVEAQLSTDERKRYAWPVYAVGLRARLRCPVCLLVVTAHEAVARWASVPIDLGAGNRFSPLVLSPSGVPRIIDQGRANADPELAVLSAMAHGRATDPDIALQIAIAAMTASLSLDAERSVLYYDLVYASLGEAARKSLQSMDPAKYEFQSEFAKRYLAEGEARGEAQGEARGQARVLLKLLTGKFGPLSPEVATRVQSASLAELDQWTDRVLSGTTLDQVLR